jgi:RecB family exonuclease
LENRFAQLTEEVHQKEEELKQWDAQLSDPESFKVLSAEEGFYDRYEKAKGELDRLMEEWMKAEEVLKEAQKKTDP